MHTHFSPLYCAKWDDKKGVHGRYICDIILGGLLEPPETAAAAGDPIEMHVAANDVGQPIDPYVHTIHSFASIGGGTQWQQWCILCLKEGKGLQVTTFYCGLCATTVTWMEEWKPTKHAYCIDSRRQCFSHHIAACFHYQSYHGVIPMRSNSSTMIHDGAVAGPQYMPGNLRRKRRGVKRGCHHTRR